MIINMYITSMSVILAGVLNMCFTKTKFYKNHKHPLDNGKCLKDGRRIFGDNKTWIGFFSMIIIAGIVQILWGQLCTADFMNGRNELYKVYDNTVLFNLYVGLLFGTAYMILELPNSFVKRRLSIIPGKTDKGIKGAIFFVVDQVDSLFGVILILAIFSPMSIGKYFFYVALGGATHIAVNSVLYALKIRKNL